ncbi:LytR/AlgR family response regulator transcription factor [Alkaliphilus pronyensis]|uniref:LytR/AlgR family response regulator transcription factor n=1 Tax=Alkaliphilus pronyensis TaxID=1482732 RepID=UPI00186575A0|nr:LytTR family DNA-binding domain-containing protein [Alkaliphilus pronyensis]
MKITIAICDDQPKQVNLLKSYIEEVKPPFNVEFLEAYSGEELLYKLDEKWIDVFFLDIEMKRLNGIETGRAIREKFPDSIIVFITGYRNYALEAFEVYSLQYILKPITIEKMKQLMGKITLRIEEKNALNTRNKVFTFKNKEEVVQLQYNDIYFFEKQLRRIRICAKKGDFKFYGTMKVLLEELDSDSFIQCQQGFIVSKAKILEVKDYFIYFRDIKEKVPISRRFKKKVVEAFEENLFR